MSEKMLTDEWDEAYAAGVADTTARMRQPGRVNELLAEAREQAIRDCIATLESVGYGSGNGDHPPYRDRALVALHVLLEGEK
jgi:hypothetical protein